MPLSAAQRAAADAAFAEYEKSSPALAELKAGKPVVFNRAAHADLTPTSAPAQVAARKAYDASYKAQGGVRSRSPSPALSTHAGEEEARIAQIDAATQARAKDTADFYAEMARRAQLGAETQFNPKAREIAARRVQAYIKLASGAPSPAPKKQVARAASISKKSSSSTLLETLIGMAKQAAAPVRPPVARPAPRPIAAPRPQVYKGVTSPSIQPGSRVGNPFGDYRTIGGTSHDAPVQRNQVATQFQRGNSAMGTRRGGQVEVLSGGRRDNYGSSKPVSIGRQSNAPIQGAETVRSGRITDAEYAANSPDKIREERTADAAKAPGQLQFEQAMQGNFSGSNYDDTQRRQIASMRKDKNMSQNPQVAYQEWMKRQQNQQDLAALPDPSQPTNT